MKKIYKVLLSILLLMISISGICLSFLLPKTKVEPETTNQQQIIAEDTGASRAGKDKKGGAVYVENGATYVMRGGTISGLSKKYGAAIYVASGATFTMEAGTITGCTAKYGGAIYVESGGTCNIKGGTITGNRAQIGYAIYVEEGGVLEVDDEAANIGNNEYYNYAQEEISAIISSGTITVGNPSSGFALHYIDLGSYPQWYVGNSMNSILENWYNTNNPTSVDTYTIRTRSWGAYKYIDGNIYVRGLSYVWNTTFTYYNGEEVRPTDSIVWFKVEPIRWIVVNYEECINGRADYIEIMSYLALTADIYFNQTLDYGNAWKTSFIRNWLNNSFYNSAFTKEEKESVLKLTIGNNISGNTGSETSDSSGAATEDFIYLLSHWDYYNSNGIFADVSAKKICSPTDFALSNYCDKHSYSLSCATVIYPNGGSCAYWTRSAGGSDSLAITANAIGLYDGLYVYNTNIGIRPVLKLKI